MIFQVRVHFGVRSIHNHNFRWQITRASDLLQAPPGHPFDSFGCMSECVADRCKVRQIHQHGVLLKPAICHIDLCIPHVLPLKNECQTNAEATPVKTESPNHSWTVRYPRSISVLATIRRCTKIHCCVNLAQQTFLGYQHICTPHLYSIALRQFFALVFSSPAFS